MQSSIMDVWFFVLIHIIFSCFCNHIAPPDGLTWRGISFAFPLSVSYIPNSYRPIPEKMKEELSGENTVTEKAVSDEETESAGRAEK